MMHARRFFVAHDTVVLVVLDAFRWFVTLDPLLRANPAWMYAAFIINIASLTFYVYAVPQMLRGNTEAVRPWALLWSGSMLAILFIVFFEGARAVLFARN